MKPREFNSKHAYRTNEAGMYFLCFAIGIMLASFATPIEFDAIWMSYLSLGCGIIAFILFLICDAIERAYNRKSNKNDQKNNN